ncbi:MAG TPA: hypothetical protein VMF64_14655 [Steroidobacteraceae bacterium]|nr:hypothetical protein [Steroidobacteraceae bacterium]
MQILTPAPPSSSASSTLRLPASIASAAWLLGALMVFTRQCDFAGIADASWAVFFLGGLYLGRSRVFALFMLLAVLVDYVATQRLGVSSYCLSPAYVFLLPAYGTLWWGGRWLARRWSPARPLRTLALTAASLAIAVSICFVISNASFYWLAARSSPPTLAGWRENFTDWYGYFLAVPFAYVSAVLAVRALSLKVRSGLIGRKAQAHAAPLGPG